MKKTWTIYCFTLLFCSSIYCFGQPSPVGEKYFNTALSFLQKKQYQKAIDNFSLSLKYIPNGENIYYWRGESKSALGSYHEAIADYNKAISLNKKVAVFYNARAWTYCLTGEYKKAQFDADTAISIEKKSEYYDTRATANGLYLYYFSALNDFNEAIKINPKPLYYYKRGLIKKANYDSIGAVQDFSQARKLDPAENFKKEKDPFFTFFTEQFYAEKKRKADEQESAYKLLKAQAEIQAKKQTDYIPGINSLPEHWPIELKDLYNNLQGHYYNHDCECDIKSYGDKVKIYCYNFVSTKETGGFRNNVYMEESGVIGPLKVAKIKLIMPNYYSIQLKINPAKDSEKPFLMSYDAGKFYIVDGHKKIVKDGNSIGTNGLKKFK